MIEERPLMILSREALDGSCELCIQDGAYMPFVHQSATDIRGVKLWNDLDG